MAKQSHTWIKITKSDVLKKLKNTLKMNDLKILIYG